MTKPYVCLNALFQQQKACDGAAPTRSATKIRPTGQLAPSPEAQTERLAGRLGPRFVKFTLSSPKPRRYPETISSSMPLRAFAIGLSTLAVIFLAIAVPFVTRYHLPLPAAAGIYLCFLSLLTLILIPATSIPNPLSAWIFPLIWCAPYLVYAAGTGDLRPLALLRLAAIGFFLVAIYRVFPVRDLARLNWQDLLIAAILIYALLGHQLVGIWNVPVNLDFLGRLFLIAAASWTWTFIRPVPELGYTFNFSPTVLRVAAISFLFFAVIAVPVGFALNFTAWHPLHKGFLDFAVSYLEIFLFIALLEEMFFRGFLQTLLSRSLDSPKLGQAIVACVFGLFHILHAPFPNWRYVILAAIAGWFYGSAFVKGGTLTASALAHALVDTVWRTFLTKT